MKEQFEKVIEEEGVPMAENWGNKTLQRIFMWCSYWYGGLYVVIEGWCELDLHDATVDGLLYITAETGQQTQHPFVDLLRRYRNGVFHFQKTYFDKRFEDFMPIVDHEKTVTWVRALHDAFSAHFLNRP